MNRIFLLAGTALITMFGMIAAAHALGASAWLTDTVIVRGTGLCLVGVLIIDVAWSWRHDKAARQEARR